MATRAKLTDKQLPQAIQFLCENGVLIHFGNIRLLKDYFILDPAWLCEVVARVKGARRTHDGVRILMHTRLNARFLIDCDS